jgi:hypothetical protein
MKTITPKFRVSYPNVFKPKLNTLSNKLEYSLEALFPVGADLSVLKKAVTDAVTEKWGDTAKVQPSAKGGYELVVDGKAKGTFKLPFKDQVSKEQDGALPAPYEKGAFFVTLKSSQKPGVVDQNVQPILDASDFYAGCYAVASVNAGAYDKVGNKGVSLYLNNIQKVADGDPLGGRTAPSDDFAAVAGSENESADKLF